MMTRKTILTLLGSALAVLAAGNALAQSFVVTYDFSSVVLNTGGTTDPTTPPATTNGVTFGSFVAVGYTGNPGASGRFSWNGNPTGGLDGVDSFPFGGSLSLTNYFEVSITPLALIELQLDTIAFIAQRSGTGIRNYAVRSSVDGYAANLPASISPANANLAVGSGNEFQWVLDSVTSAQSGSLVTLGAPYSNSAVTLRFYGWNAEGPSGTFSIDNVIIAGKTRGVVPEPTGGSLLALGLVAAGFWRRASKAR